MTSMARLPAALLVLLLPACAHQPEASKADDPPPAAEPPAPSIDAAPPVDAAPPLDAGPVGIVPAFVTGAIRITDTCTGKPVHVFAAAVEGNHLLVKVGTGGCESAKIWACSDGKLMESLPPKLRIEVHHTRIGNCEKLMTDRLRFDLSDLMKGAEHYESVTIQVGDKTAEWKP